MTSEVNIQMRFADVDRLGHVNNVNLMHYYDLGKNDFMERLLDMHVAFESEGLITAATNASYLEQVTPGETIAVRTSLLKIGTKSFTLHQQIINTDTQTLKSECTCVMVAFDFLRQQSIPLPDAWRQALEKETIP